MKLKEAKKLSKEIAKSLGITFVDEIYGTTSARPNSMIMAGSMRRCKSDVGDIDAVVTAPITVDDIDKLVGPNLVWSRGSKQIFFTMACGTKVNFWLLDDDESFGAMMLHTTGSQQHNIILRKIAKKLGYKLNQYGLYDGLNRIAGKTEEEIYNKLPTASYPNGKKWVEPENR